MKFLIIILLILNIIYITKSNPTLPGFCAVGDVSVTSPSYAKDVILSVGGFSKDIEILLSMGDTITSAFGAGDISSSNINEYRGYSFFNGNHTNHVSVMNIFKTAYTSTFIGGSTTLLEGGFRYDNVHYKQYDGYNAASRNNEDYYNSQLNYLYTSATSDYGVSGFNSKWKLINVYMGVFKMCDICDTLSVEYQTNPLFWRSYYENIINEVFGKFNSKVILNLMSLPDLSQFYSSSSSTCKTFNINKPICKCLWTQPTATLKAIQVAANQGMKNATLRWKQTMAGTVGLSTSSLGVINSPFLENTIFPSNTISPVDCFHPNKLGHELMAVGLWNNIRESTKSTSVSLSTEIICDVTFDPIYSISYNSY